MWTRIRFMGLRLPHHLCLTSSSSALTFFRLGFRWLDSSWPSLTTFHIFICLVHADILSSSGFPLELTVPRHISRWYSWLVSWLSVGVDHPSSRFTLTFFRLTVPHYISLDSVCVTPFGHARSYRPDSVWPSQFRYVWYIPSASSP